MQMHDYRHAVIIILVMGLLTLATRIVPVLIFGRREKVPEYILYLGRVVPYTAMGLLIVYCLKDVSILDEPHAIPEIISMVIVCLTYLWKRNSIFSVVAGTALYMALVQMVF
jgi:branched-subunit amino acid transport protein AzlD